MKTERHGLGCLGAALGALVTAPLALGLLTVGLHTALAGLLGSLCALGGYRLLGRRCSAFGLCLSVLFPLLAALPGLYFGYAELIYRDNLRFGCTRQEALALVPAVLQDPANRPQLILDLGGILLLALLTALLAAKYQSLRRQET